MARKIRLFAASIALCGLCVLAVISQAEAAKIDKSGQKRLETLFGDLLKQYENAAGSNGAELVTEGEILVEPADTYYAVTLPHLMLKKADKTYTEIGMIAVNALPGDTDGEWKMTIAMPTPVVHYDADAKPLVTVEFGGQNFAGVWNEKVKNFTKINAQYKDISIRQHAEQVRITIPSAQMVYDLKPDGKDLWSGPADIKISNLQAVFEAKGATAQIDEITMHSGITGYSPAEAIAYQDNINALAESYQAGDQPSISGEHVLGFYNLLTGMMGKVWDGFDFTMAIKGVSLTRPPIPGAPAGALKISDGLFGFAMGGFREGQVKMQIKAAYNGLSVTPQSDAYRNAAPDHMNFDLSINQIPYKDLIALGRGALETAATNPQAGKMAVLPAMMAAPQLLTQAGTNLTLSNTQLGNDQYNVLADALFTANMNAMLGATGNAKMQFAGLDQLIDSLNKAAADPATDAARKEKINKALASLTIFKMAGQMDKDAKGNDVRTYNFELNEKGQTLLNGTDLQMLLQAAKGAQ